MKWLVYAAMIACGLLVLTAISATVFLRRLSRREPWRRPEHQGHYPPYNDPNWRPMAGRTIKSPQDMVEELRREDAIPY